MSLEITGFSTNLIECSSKLAGDCCPIDSTLDVRPWAYEINKHGGTDSCDYIIKRRPEKGWTLDFVFNREELPWSVGSVFYFFGVRDENNPSLYADNNLSFGFTSDGRIQWNAYRYSGSCVNDSYKETFYLDSGVTPILCENGTSKDFNITIVFDRHLRLTECDIPNTGGWNDLITGDTITNAMDIVLSGATEQNQYIEELNKDWNDERYARLGTLKIYLNGWPIYKIDNWEEIIPSNRGFQPFIQSWGGGTTGSGGVHTGVTGFNLKRIKYIEEPLNALQVKHHYITSTKPLFDIIECQDRCEEKEIIPFSERTVYYEDDSDGDGERDIIYTEGEDILII
jgi:hypothetical protein